MPNGDATATVPPAQRLKGLVLTGGWVVAVPVHRAAGATGGNFSCCYLAKHQDGREAFVKALDYSCALKSGDSAAALNSLTAAFIFERDLLARCRDRRMDRITRAIGSGTVTVDESVIGEVQYLILEGADHDLRKHLASSEGVDLAWKLRSLHHMATGLFQLHGSDIAHQDLKPSNVLVFGGTTSKLADLGCASVRGSAAPRDGFEVAGDFCYAPPEARYGYREPEWTTRRIGCDAYLLGSMIVFLFSGVSATALLFEHLDPKYRPGTWVGTYAEVLPYVREAFARAMGAFARDLDAVGDLRQSLTSAAIRLCDPEPDRRRHPASPPGPLSRLSLERYVSLFNLLAGRAENGMITLIG